MSKRHFNIRVHGKVQGVWFRGSTREKAQALGICGFVRNEADGSVYAEAEGHPETIEQFLNWCRQGPPLARVDRIDVEEAPLTHFEDFTIQRWI